MAAQTDAPPTADAPYLGLRNYGEDDADFFFGRESESAVIIGNLRASRLTLLYGNSGVGKSSLLRAGVAASLRGHARRDVASRGAPRLIPVVFSRWSEAPLTSLIATMEAAARAVAPSPSKLELPASSFVDAVEALTEQLHARALVLLDQFEEYFLYRETQDPLGRLATELAECVNRPDCEANLLISIREDEYWRLGDLFRDHIANVYANNLRLEYLDATCARQAIERPVERYNARHETEYAVEDALVDAVLEGVRLDRAVDGANGSGYSGGDRADGDFRTETTYLQLVMKRMWDEETEAGSTVLRRATLERLGGPHAIIASHLDRAMGNLSASEQEAAATAFSFLVTRSGTKIALTTNDLSELSGLPRSRLAPVLRRLAASDLHVLRPVVTNPSSGDASYEIFHDALARPIVEWRTHHHEREEAARQRAQAARLERERTDKEVAQRAAAEAARSEARERRRKRLALAGLAVVVTGFVVSAIVFAVIQRRDARRLARADVSNQIAGRLSDFWGRPHFGPDTIALSAFEDYLHAPTFNARQQVLQALQENVALPTILSGHVGPADSVAFSDDRRRLVASGGADGTVRLWRRNGRPFGAPLQIGGGSAVRGIVFAANGASLATSRGDGAVDVWTLPRTPLGTARVRRLAPRAARNCASREPCYPIALSPDGRTLVAAGAQQKGLRLWHSPTRDLRDARPAGHIRTKLPYRIHALAFSANGRRLAVADNGGLTLWQVSRRGKVTYSAVVRHFQHPVFSVAWRANNAVAAGTRRGITLLKFSARGGFIRGGFIATRSPVYAVAFAGAGRLAISGGADAEVTAWNTHNFQPAGPLRQHDDQVNSVAISPDGRTIASASDDALVKLWPLSPAGALASTVVGNRAHSDLLVAPGGRLALANDRGTQIWRLGGNVLVNPPRRVAELPARTPIAVGGNIVAGAAAGALGLWDIDRRCATARPSCLLARASSRRVGGPLSAAVFDSTGQRLATGTTRGVLALWDTSDPRALRYLGGARQATRIDAIAFRPRHSDTVMTAAADGSVRLWRRPDARHPGRITAIGPSLHGDARFAMRAAAFSPDGSLLAAGGADQQVTLWDVAAPSHPREVGHLSSSSSFDAAISSIAFSPDGRTLAAGDTRARVCFYDVHSLRFVGSDICLTGSANGAAVTAVRFDPRGRFLFAAGVTLPVVAWKSVLWSQSRDERTMTELHSAVCRFARRNLTIREWRAVFAQTDLVGHRDWTCRNYPLP